LAEKRQIKRTEDGDTSTVWDFYRIKGDNIKKEIESVKGKLQAVLRPPSSVKKSKGEHTYAD
jgi:hypothetical protein